MKIDKNLNLVFKVERESGTLHIHSTPISNEVFERYYLVLAKTLAAIFQHGITAISGPKVAALLLKTIAQRMGEWEGEEGVQRGLLAHIHQTSNVAVPAPGGGWEAIPLQLAIDRGMFDADELLEVDGITTFFICVCAVAPIAQVRPIQEMLTEIWGAQFISSGVTEFARSLPTSTVAGSFGAKAVSFVAF